MEENSPDLYATLGLDRNCTTAQIRAAYRLLAKRHHPDVNHGSPEAVTRLQALNAAHEVLSNPGFRRAYDRELAETERSERPAKAASKIERNIAQDVRLRIEDFLRGVTLEVKVNDPANANGMEAFELTVPPETAPGTRFRIPREEPFSGGFVSVRVQALPSVRFKVRGADLKCDLRINARRAATGGTEMVPSATGRPLQVQIQAGIGRGETIRLTGEGMPKPRGGRGDLLVRITYRPEVRITRTSR